MVALPYSIESRSDADSMSLIEWAGLLGHSALNVHAHRSKMPAW